MGFIIDRLNGGAYMGEFNILHFPWSGLNVATRGATVQHKIKAAFNI